MKVSGVFTALVTPMKSGEVDYDGLRKNIRFQIKNGVNGILPLGTTGETPTLSREEQDKIIKLAVEEAAGKIPVMVGTGSNSTEHTVENTRIAKELGADIALVVTPYYNKPSQEGIYLHFKTITGKVDIPLVIYNIQSRTGTNIETATLKRIAGLPHIIGVKEASCNINQMGDVINSIAKNHKNFSVMSGDDAYTLPLLSLGGDGVISVVSNLVPDLVVKMVKAGLNGDFIKARALHYQLLPVFKGAFIEGNPTSIKTAMNICGMPAGECRLPLCGMSAENEKKLKEILKNMELI
jgi:4-hydroxy-tetrahydrodipicolinate synthase